MKKLKTFSEANLISVNGLRGEQGILPEAPSNGESDGRARLCLFTESDDGCEG